MSLSPDPPNPSATTEVGRCDEHVAAGAPAARQCGRCRLWFDGLPATSASALPAWWLCPDCHESLFTKG